jgi:hypothetical protein
MKKIFRCMKQSSTAYNLKTEYHKKSPTSGPVHTVSGLSTSSGQCILSTKGLPKRMQVCEVHRMVQVPLIIFPGGNVLQDYGRISPARSNGHWYDLLVLFSQISPVSCALVHVCAGMRVHTYMRACVCMHVCSCVCACIVLCHCTTHADSHMQFSLETEHSTSNHSSALLPLLYLPNLSILNPWPLPLGSPLCLSILL